MKKDIILTINEGKDEEYYFATKNEKGEFLIYASDFFKLSEIDIINLIKICLIEARSKSIGKKILGIYRDSTEHKKHIAQEKLKLIGITDDATTEPTKLGRKPKIK